jgi:hypothetical protein
MVFNVHDHLPVFNNSSDPEIKKQFRVFLLPPDGPGRSVLLAECLNGPTLICRLTPGAVHELPREISRNQMLVVRTKVGINALKIILNKVYFFNKKEYN